MATTLPIDPSRRQPSILDPGKEEQARQLVMLWNGFTKALLVNKAPTLI